MTGAHFFQWNKNLYSTFTEKTYLNCESGEGERKTVARLKNDGVYYDWRAIKSIAIFIMCLWIYAQENVERVREKVSAKESTLWRHRWQTAFFCWMKLKIMMHACTFPNHFVQETPNDVCMSVFQVPVKHNFVSSLPDSMSSKVAKNYL